MVASTRRDGPPTAPGNHIAPLPVALLVPLFEAPGAEPLTLAARDLCVGSGPTCDLSIPFASLGVRPEHARLRWCGDGFELSAMVADAPTLMNDQPLGMDTAVALQPGCTLALGRARYHFAGIGGMHGASGGDAASSEHERLLYGLATLAPETLVERALALFRHVAPGAVVALVASDAAAEFGAYLPPLSDPRFDGQRARIEHVFACGETLQDQAVTADSGGVCARLQPIFGPDGHPLAAAVLVWPRGDAAAIERESAASSAALAHVGLAFRNSVLFSRLATLNRDLEQKVVERTRALEDSRARLVAQDRLATLGRLVAAIAHELNNPAGAIASLSGTLDRLLPSVRSADERLATLFAAPTPRAAASAWLDRARLVASEVAPDSRRRRELERAWQDALEARHASAAAVVAAKLARTGLDPAALAAADPLAGEFALELATLIDEQYTFCRSLGSLGECAGNVARIVGGLKTYAHLDQSVAQVADVRRGIEAALSVLHSRIPAGVSVETHVDPVPLFLQRPGELIQVWTNLLDNALRAMGGNGTMVVGCHEVPGQVVVEITDSGLGVPEAIAGRIFELDVTSRGPSAGLGLGLAICKNIVEQGHGGRIEFESRPGHTTFRVSLPTDRKIG